MHTPDKIIKCPHLVNYWINNSTFDAVIVKKNIYSSKIDNIKSKNISKKN